MAGSPQRTEREENKDTPCKLVGKKCLRDDVGFKAIFRRIRVLCSGCDPLQGGMPEYQLVKHLQTFVASQCAASGLSTDPAITFEMATLMLAFRLST